MLAVLSMSSIAGGTFVTYWAERRPAAAQPRLELCGGLLLVAGLVLIGTGLPLFRI